MTDKELNKIVKLLKDRQPVWVSGHSIRAMRVHGASPGAECDYCEMDCLCKGVIAEICEALNLHAKTPYHLWLCQ